MRKLILKMDVTLDGFVSGLNGESDWIFATADEGSNLWELETVRHAGLHVMGRKTFADMANYWPSSTEPFAEPMNSIPKLVFTRSGKIDFEAITRSPPPGIQDANAHAEKTRMARASPEEAKQKLRSWREALVESDLVAGIARHKAEAGNPLVAYGGATFARELIQRDLVDEYRLVVRPVALGKGLPIFDGLEKQRPLKLVSSSVFPGGATGHIFTRAGR
jgi:dihydrofolate reductase